MAMHSVQEGVEVALVAFLSGMLTSRETQSPKPMGLAI